MKTKGHTILNSIKTVLNIISCDDAPCAIETIIQSPHWLCIGVDAGRIRIIFIKFGANASHSSNRLLNQKRTEWTEGKKKLQEMCVTHIIWHAQWDRAIAVATAATAIEPMEFAKLYIHSFFFCLVHLLFTIVISPDRNGSEHRTQNKCMQWGAAATYAFYNWILSWEWKTKWMCVMCMCNYVCVCVCVYWLPTVVRWQVFHSSHKCRKIELIKCNRFLFTLHPYGKF